MAFELAEINPTSVPINLLNPRTGTKFGDRELMDPWEVVKWVAIFRLILPDALFRLCGGRVENLGELQPLAVKAGLNGVMMGNFLTTLGVDPGEDRASFEELGLNVARQPDNGANPRPDNRSGWLEGETPRTPVDELIDSQADANFWDPSTQLRVIKKKRTPPGLPGAALRARRGGLGRLSDVAERLAELRRSGLHRRLRLIEGPQGPRVLLDGAEVLLLCSNNYLGLADHPRVRAGGRRGRRALRRRRRRLAADLGLDVAAPQARGPAGGVQGLGGGAAVRLRLPGQHRRSSRRSPGAARSSSPTSSTTPASSTAAGSRGPRPSSTATATPSTSSGACARPAPGRG